MGKQGGKNKKALGDASYESNSKSFKSSENSPRALDKDTALFISMSEALKAEGNRLFQRRDYEGAMLKYDKAIKLLPRNHINVSYLRSNIAECYMQLGIAEFPKAIHECNLALEVTPKYTKALLKRARCYEALNRLDLALRDVGTVLTMEQNNLMAVEIEERVKDAISRQGSGNENPVHLVPLPEYFDLLQSPRTTQVSKEKTPKEESNAAAKEKVSEESGDGPRKDEKIINRKIEAREAFEKALNRQNKERKSEEKTLNRQVKEREADWKTLYRQVMEREAGEKDLNRRQVEERKADEKDLNRQIKEREEAESEDHVEEKKTEDKVVVEVERIISGTEEKPGKTVKLVYGEDIRKAQIPLNCDILKLREIVSDRFPSSRAVLVKYRDQEGDLVTITMAEELKLAEQSAQHGTFKLFVVEVPPDQDPFFEKITKMGCHEDFYPSKKCIAGNGLTGEGKEPRIESACINDWIVQFAQFFKNYVGFDVDSYLDLHENAIKLYSDAMEETVTSDEAQDLFTQAADKFQEMAALALFNWGNVHMARARKRVYFPEDSSKEQVLSHVKSAYDWAMKEYVKAGEKYEQALKIKPNFYEAVLALGQQQFERAKLSWYYAVGTSADLTTWPSTEALQLYNNAEENMEKGMLMWEASEAQRLTMLSQPSKTDNLLQKMKLGGVLKNVRDDEAAEQAVTMRSQINVIWGTMLYERSIMEFKLGLPVWQECLEVSLEKFELAGASPSDIAVMVKNHCSNDATLEGLGFNINEIIQAWNEMYEAKRWQSSIPSFRVEPLLRRRVSKLYNALEHA